MQIYLVGGAVRDELLGLEVVDRDFVVVGGTPQALIEQGYIQVGKDFPVFLHPQSKEEYALARTERKAGKGYTGFTCYAAPDVTLEQDLQRRDLTINAIAKDSKGELIDPYAGVKDLEQRILRHVSPAFNEDPLRILRVARFAARLHTFGFEVAPPTWQLMQQMVAAGELSELSPERIWQELSRSLTGPAPHIFCQLLSDLEAWPQLLFKPEQRVTLQPIDWQLLKAAASNPARLPLNVVYALFVLSMQRSNPQFNADLLQQALRVPNDCTEVSSLVLRIERLLYSAHMTPAEVVQVLKLADPLRRPQRWQDALRALRTTTDDNKVSDTSPERKLTQLERAQQAYCEVSAAPFIDAGLSGAEIGKSLARERLEVVSEALGMTNSRS